ncbi:MAG: DUF2927 domain-containing protein, partial [Pseudomonadota bacterium]
MSLTLLLSLRVAAAGVAAFACIGCADYLDGQDWEGYEQTALVLGKMRLDRAPQGMPVSDLALADNFRRIAFGLEDGVFGGTSEEETAGTSTNPTVSGAGRLRRWRRPVRWQITSLGKSAQGYLRAVDETAQRIATATGHDIARVGKGEPANLAVLFLRPQ